MNITIIYEHYIIDKYCVHSIGTLMSYLSRSGSITFVCPNINKPFIKEM